MSKLSTLFTAGIFIVFLAVLFHYFCRAKKKPVIVQQQVQVPEGYVYPITSNQMVGGPNFSPMQPPFIMPQNVPYPFPYPNNIVIGSGNPPHQQHPQHPAPYPPVNVNMSHAGNTNPTQTPIDSDLPPPYHVAVASAPYPPK